MEPKEERQNEIVIIRSAGRLDATTSHEVFERCSKIIAASARSLTLNCTDLAFLSSSGLRTLLLVAKQLQVRGGRAAIFGEQDVVREVFDLSGFSALFSFSPSEADALAQLRKQ